MSTNSGDGTERGTLYVPPRHKVEDMALVRELMDEFSFVDLITTAPTLRITHIPVYVDFQEGAHGTVYGHIARQNEQWRAIEAGAEATVIFRGPHAYISPAWYGNQTAVPTWNFAVVHVSGKLEEVGDFGEFRESLARLTEKNEGKYSEPGAYEFGELPETYVRNMMRQIIGFRLRVERVEAKFKLGQERSAGDRESIVRHVTERPQGRGMGEFTRAFYEKMKG